MKHIIMQPVTKEQCKDTGMAMVLICLLIEMMTHQHRYIPWAFGMLMVTMIAPVVFKPLAIVWFGCSRLLGFLMSHLLLTLIFFLLVTPVGILRKIFGKDSMQTNQWKKSPASVFKKRYHRYTSEDIERPY